MRIFILVLGVLVGGRLFAQEFLPENHPPESLDNFYNFGTHALYPNVQNAVWNPSSQTWTATFELYNTLKQPFNIGLNKYSVSSICEMDSSTIQDVPTRNLPLLSETIVLAGDFTAQQIQEAESISDFLSFFSSNVSNAVLDSYVTTREVEIFVDNRVSIVYQSGNVSISDLLEPTMDYVASEVIDLMLNEMLIEYGINTEVGKAFKQALSQAFADHLSSRTIGQIYNEILADGLQGEVEVFMESQAFDDFLRNSLDNVVESQFGVTVSDFGVDIFNSGVVLDRYQGLSENALFEEMIVHFREVALSVIRRNFYRQLITKVIGGLREAIANGAILFFDFGLGVVDNYVNESDLTICLGVNFKDTQPSVLETSYNGQFMSWILEDAEEDALESRLFIRENCTTDWNLVADYNSDTFEDLSLLEVGEYEAYVEVRYPEAYPIQIEDLLCRPGLNPDLCKNSITSDVFAFVKSDGPDASFTRDIGFLDFEVGCGGIEQAIRLNFIGIPGRSYSLSYAPPPPNVGFIFLPSIPADGLDGTLSFDFNLEFEEGDELAFTLIDELTACIYPDTVVLSKGAIFPNTNLSDLPDCPNNQGIVQVSIDNSGSEESYILSDGTQEITILPNGTASFPPYPLNRLVTVTISDPEGNCTQEIGTVRTTTCASVPTPSAFPTVIRSPVKGEIRVSQDGGTDCSGSRTDMIWCFNQWGAGCDFCASNCTSNTPSAPGNDCGSRCTHCTTGGLGGIDDTYAWDANLDGNAENGEPVYAIEEGTIEKMITGWGGTSVGQLLIKHSLPDGTEYYSGYLHMNVNSYQHGDCVMAGEQIGTISDVGAGGLVHLHFAIYEMVNNQLVSRNATILDNAVQANFGIAALPGRTANPTPMYVYFSVPEYFDGSGITQVTNVGIGSTGLPTAGYPVTNAGNGLFFFVIDDIPPGTYADNVLYDLTFDIGGSDNLQGHGINTVHFVGDHPTAFNDVDADDQATCYIDRGTAAGIFRGSGREPRFFPEAPLTRGQAAKVVTDVALKTGQINQLNISGTSFDDVDDCYEFFPYIQTLKNLGHVSGFAGTNIYAPENTVTYAEFAKILVNTLDLENLALATTADLRAHMPYPITNDSDDPTLIQYMETLEDKILFFDIDCEPVDGENESLESILTHARFDATTAGNASYIVDGNGVIYRKDMAILLAKVYQALEIAAGNGLKPTANGNEYAKMLADVSNFTIIGSKLALPPMASGEAPSTITVDITMFDNETKEWDGPEMDAEGNFLAYYWTIDGGTLDMIAPNDFTAVRFTPPVVAAPTVFEMYTWIGDTEGNVAQAFIDITVLPAGSCPPPDNLTVETTSQTSATLSWSNIGDGTSVATSTVEISTDNSSFTEYASSLTTNSVSLTGLSTGQIYYVRVSATCTDMSISPTSAVENFVISEPAQGAVGDCPNDEDDDDEDPIFLNCPTVSYVFPINSSNTCTALANWSAPVAIDNCSVTVQQLSGPSPGRNLEVGNNPVTYLAQDGNGNSATCSFTVQVVDGQTLQFTNCPTEILTVGINNAESCQAYLNWSIPAATDNCNVTVMQTSGPEVGSLQNVGIYQVVYEATNNGTGAALETATCSFFVEVEDSQTLEFVNCPTETLVFGTNVDLCSVTANWSIPVATDNCEVTVTHVSGPRPGDVLAPGTYEVVYEATNNGVGAALETATCSFSVLVQETQNPEINCPQDVFVESDPGVCEAAVENIQLEFAIDNCPYTVTWTSAPADVTGTGTSTSDNASGAIFPVGITTVTYQIRENDDFGNGNVVATCDLIVEVTDTEAPMITCPPSVVIGTNDDGQDDYDCATDYTWTHPTPTDNCLVTVYELTYTNPDGSVEGPLDWGADAGAMVGRNFALGTTTILYHVQDAEGNVTECTWTVEVIDDEDPMIFCEENLATNVITYLGTLEIFPRDTVVATISVPVSATISDVNIPALVGSHPEMGDLKITLTSPAGTTITLFDGLCTGTPNFDLTLDDNTASSVNTAPCNPLGGGGTFAPADALAAFNGENSQGDWVLTFSSQLAGTCGELEAWDLEIIGNDNTVPSVNRLQVIADANTCAYFLRGTDFDPRFIDNCDGAFITHDYLAGPFDSTLMGSQFPIGETEILWTVTDAAGNTATCPMIIEVLDNQAPTFTNCARPDIIANPTPGVCDAFVNFSLPLAVDNCGSATVNQIDPTGLTTGMRFPVGTTILQYEAVDPAGNRTECEFRVIVNDNQPVVMTAASCPEDVETAMDAGDCEAIVNGIAPNFTDNCTPNLSYIYKIEDQAGVEIASGFTNASGASFPLGSNRVTYRAQDQPVLLITEVTHEIQEVLGGNDAIPPYIGFRGLPDGDYLEITNFGPAPMNIGGLDIERITATGIDHFRVPALEILEPGETFVLQFGNDDASPANHYYAIECATDLTSTDGAAYIISHSGRVLDVAAVNGFDPVGLGSAAIVAAADWSGAIFDGLAGIRRTSVYDDNDATDFVAATVCGEITIGQYNPDFAPAPANPSLTANQARKPNKQECDFTVTVTDEEAAVCGSYQPYDDFVFSGPATISAGDCFEATLNVSEAYQLADVNTSLTGVAGSFGNLRITLISPEGDEVLLADNECVDNNGFDINFDSDSITLPFVYDACLSLDQSLHLRPRQDLNAFNTRPSAGTWTLRIAHDATEDFDDVTLNNWTLSLSELISYAQLDETIENDFRECGAEFTWLHSGIWDNCPGGSVEVTYLFRDTIQDSYVITRDRYGRDTTRFFDVGITTVRYTLTDAVGNMSSCSFDLTVLDTEPPVLVCPADTTLYLAGGECDIVYIPTDWFTEDNCGVVDTITAPDWNLPLPIGINPVDLTVVDSSGNETVCTYIVTVVEYDPPNPQMACIGDINVSLDRDCEVEITASMLLAGDEYYCFDNYEVSLLQRNEEGTYDTLLAPIVGVDQIADTLVYQVYDPRNDDLCWGYLHVGFFEAPEFVCPADRNIECNGSFDPLLNGEPILLSCALAGATVSYADTLEQFGPCDGPRAIMHRTWLVQDAYGNSASCVQDITMEAFDPAAIVFPADKDGDSAPALSCAAVANDPTLTEPSNTGYPFIPGGRNVFGTNFCSASFLFTDEVFDICAGSYQIVRTWKVLSTCGAVEEGVTLFTAIQVIRVLDQDRPALVCPEDEQISTGGLGCFGEYAVPVPVVEESCSGWSYEVSTSGGTLSFINGRYYLTDLEEGTYTIRYYVEDECGGFSECIYSINVTDQIAASASCEDQINVSLDVHGTATIIPEDIDAGSTDFCSAVNLAVRKEVLVNPDNCTAVTPGFTAWGEAVTMNCCELNELVKVELQVTDENGNSSTCWTNVLVEDKIAPVCLAPDEVTVTCISLRDVLPDNLEDAIAEDPQGTAALLDAMFGFAGTTDNCGPVTLTQTISDNRNSCGVGVIHRRFTATDAQGLSPVAACLQTINVVEVHDYVIELPADRENDACEVPDYDGIGFTGVACDLLTVNTTIDTLSADADECYKLRITYEAINWCEYGAEAGLYDIPRDADRDGNYAELTYLHVSPGPELNTTTDDIAVLSSSPVLTPGNAIGFLDRQDAGAAGYPATLTGFTSGADQSDPYATDRARGGFRYVQYIKVYDANAPIVEAASPAECFQGNQAGCEATVSLSFTAFDECSFAEPVVELDEFYDPTQEFATAQFLSAAQVVANGDSTFTLTLAGVPAGNHAFRIRASDGCGNSNLIIVPFCVEPAVAPAPICIQTLTVTLMPNENDAVAVLWASDLVASPIVDCFGNEITQFSIYLESIAGEQGFEPAVGNLSAEFDCLDANSEVAVRLYAFDQAGQFDYCQVIVEVQLTNDNLCNPDAETAIIAGTIRNLLDEPLLGVNVALEGAAQSEEMETQEDGMYHFAGLLQGEDYTVSPTHFHDYLNGVRTSDIVGMTRHILGVEPFNSPYQILAGDVNGDTDIDVGDILATRSLILGIVDAFPNGMPSWSFVAAGHEFPVLTNPWFEEFPQVNNYNNLSANVVAADFVAVKLGDVNFSANTGLSGRSLPTAPVRALELEMMEKLMVPGNVFEIQIKAPQLKDFSGFQGTLKIDQSKAQLLSIVPGIIAQGQYAADPAANEVRISWNWPQSIPVTSGSEALLTLRVKVLAIAGEEQLSVSELFSFGGQLTTPEAYLLNDERARVDLVFLENEVADGYRLLPNEPNPFKHQTTIRYQLPRAEARVTITITDATGRVVREFRQAANKGLNQLVVQSSDLRASGVFSYTVSAGKWTASRRMVVME